MKIFISVCDDENKIAAELEAYLIKVFDGLNLKYEIDVYYSGEELYEAMESGAHYDLIFLDIMFAREDTDGVDIGKRLRHVKGNNTVFIVYMSWDKEYSMQLFDVQPLNFLLKPLNYEEVEKVLRRYMELAGLWNTHFSYKVGQDVFKVRVRDIVYLESLDRKLILHLADGSTAEFYGSLKKAYKEQLQACDFLYIHNAYIVNYDYVEHYSYENLKLEGYNISFPVSQGRRKEVRTAFHSVLEKRGSKP